MVEFVLISPHSLTFLPPVNNHLPILSSFHLVSLSSVKRCFPSLSIQLYFSVFISITCMYAWVCRVCMFLYKLCLSKVVVPYTAYIAKCFTFHRVFSPRVTIWSSQETRVDVWPDKYTRVKYYLGLQVWKLTFYTLKILKSVVKMFLDFGKTLRK